MTKKFDKSENPNLKFCVQHFYFWNEWLRGWWAWIIKALVCVFFYIFRGLIGSRPRWSRFSNRLTPRVCISAGAFKTYYVTTVVDKFSVFFLTVVALVSGYRPCQCRNPELIGVLDGNQFLFIMYPTLYPPGFLQDVLSMLLGRDANCCWHRLNWTQSILMMMLLALLNSPECFSF